MPPALHVVVLDEELPFPLTSGKRIRSYHLLTRLAARHRITYLCHRNPDPVEQAAAEAAMQAAGIRPYVLPDIVPRKSGIGFPIRLLKNLFSSLPYSVMTHASRAMRQAVRELATADPPDLWFCEWTPYSQVLRGEELSAPWLVMAHNVESRIWLRYAEAEKNPLMRWYIRKQHRKFHEFERWAYSTAECSIAVSDEDAHQIRSEYGGRHVEVIDNGVDTRTIVPDRTILRDPFRILFLGSLDWRPNLDAVSLFLDEIFPKVRDSEPRAILQLVGRKPPSWLQQRIAKEEGVELHADVADVRPFLARAGLMAVPLRIGGGSRLKILEALAAGLPVVTTRIGVEGLHLEPVKQVSMVEGPGEMAGALLAAMQAPEIVRHQAERGRQRVLERYDWSELANRMEAVWLSIVVENRPRTSESAHQLVI